jgi:hypothetical protein
VDGGGLRLIWNPWGLFGLVALIVCTAMAAFVLATRPDRTQNRRLALFLGMQGLIFDPGPLAQMAYALSGVARQTLAQSVP